MKKTCVWTTLSLITFFLLSSCNLVRSVPPGATEAQPTGNPLTDEQTRIALAVQQTQTASVLALPEITSTPTLTPTITLTPTPEVPMVSVSVETNCRTGPGVVYDKIAVLMPGTPAEVIGKNAYGDTWVIKLPSNPAVTCWLWGQYATVVGNTSGLTIYNPPPTPTPAAGFTVSYLSKMTCCDYIFRFEIKNTGSITWRSFRITITDLTTSVTVLHSSDAFRDFSGCTLINTLLDLEAGETGVVVNEMPAGFNYVPTGHNMRAEVTLFENDGLAGLYKKQTIDFVP